MNIDKVTETLGKLGFREAGNRYDESKIAKLESGALKFEIKIGKMKLFKKERRVEGFAGFCDMIVGVNDEHIICNAQQIIEPPAFSADNRLGVGLNDFREVFIDQDEALSYIFVATESPFGPLYGPLLPLPTEENRRR